MHSAFEIQIGIRSGFVLKALDANDQLRGTFVNAPVGTEIISCGSNLNVTIHLIKHESSLN